MVCGLSEAFIHASSIRQSNRMDSQQRLADCMPVGFRTRYHSIHNDVDYTRPRYGTQVKTSYDFQMVTTSSICQKVILPSRIGRFPDGKDPMVQLSTIYKTWEYSRRFPNGLASEYVGLGKIGRPAEEYRSRVVLTLTKPQT